MSENAQACDIQLKSLTNHKRQGFTRKTACVIKQTQRSGGQRVTLASVANFQPIICYTARQQTHNIRDS